MRKLVDDLRSLLRQALDLSKPAKNQDSVLARGRTLHLQVQHRRDAGTTAPGLSR